MKVDKDQFDNLLSRMMQQPPEKTVTIKSEKKGGMIIPPRPDSAKPRLLQISTIRP
jgi:hypothetical protein